MVTLLDSLPEPERRALTAAGRRRRYQRREVVFHEGEPADTLHLVLSGRVAVRATTPLGDVATLAVLGRGDTFGELALLGDDRRTATVLALEPTETWSVRAPDLFEARARHPQIDRFLTDTLAAYVRRLSALVLEALYLPVDKRVARRLCDLARVYAGAEAPIEIHLTQDDIASLAGASRPTVNRVLGNLAEVGAVSVTRGRIVILDVDRLDRAGR